jgi:hypothetical protein
VPPTPPLAPAPPPVPPPPRWLPSSGTLRWEAGAECCPRRKSVGK